jgi:hypothetical protein
VGEILAVAVGRQPPKLEGANDFKPCIFKAARKAAATSKQIYDTFHRSLPPNANQNCPNTPFFSRQAFVFIFSPACGMMVSPCGPPRTRLGRSQR